MNDPFDDETLTLKIRSFDKLADYWQAKGERLAEDRILLKLINACTCDQDDELCWAAEAVELIKGDSE